VRPYDPAGGDGTRVTFCDTADVYGGGKSEEIIGAFLKERKERPFVATKIGRARSCIPIATRWKACRLASRVRSSGSASRQSPYFNCIVSQWRFSSRATFSTGCNSCASREKIREFGASVETVEEALLCLEQPGLTSLQVIFNVFRQKPARELFDRALEKNVVIVVRLPLASGLLGGHLTGQTVFAPTDHRNYNRDGQAFNVGKAFCGLEFKDGLGLVGRLQTFLPPGVTLPQFAIRYILDHPAVSVVIPGSSRPTQTTANAVATKLPRLSPECHEALRVFHETEVAKPHSRAVLKRISDRIYGINKMSYEELGLAWFIL